MLKYKHTIEVIAIKKIFVFTLMIVGILALSGCDVIQEEIERAKSIEFEDVRVDLQNRDVYLKITSDAEEQVIVDMTVNGETYELTSEGDDWYLLKDVPIEKSYDVESVNYRTSMGMQLSLNPDYSITLEEALSNVHESYIIELNDEPLELGSYTFSSTDNGLAEIESTVTHEVDKVSSWLWVVTEEAYPEYIVVDQDGVKIIELPESADKYIE